MKFVCLLILGLISVSSFGSDYSLSGVWYNVADTHAKPIRFIKIGDTFHFNGQEKFLNENGTLAYTIDQTVKLQLTAEGTISGSIDVFDSRGCSYKNLPAVGEFTESKEVNLLLTYPRYRVVKITVGPRQPYYRNVYCESPYGYRYVCGRERVNTHTRTECELLEKVEVPVQIRKN